MKYTLLTLFILGATYRHVYALYQSDYFPITESPYAAYLNVFNPDIGNLVCSATIISEHWLVTAGHCAANRTIKVRTGVSNSRRGIMSNVSEIVLYDGYFTEPLAYDIALIKVEKKIEFNESQYPIPITRESPKPGDIINVSGYGYSHYRQLGDNLQRTKFPVIDDDTCRKNFTIIQTQFCASVENADACGGDSGGPAELDGKLIGILSQGCEYDAPIVLMKISEFYDWIVNVTGINYD